MASRTDTVDFILVQVSGVAAVSARKMFGERTLYCDGKVVGLVCDDELFVKTTEAGRAYVNGSAIKDKAPYSGAKPCLLIPAKAGTMQFGLAA